MKLIFCGASSEIGASCIFLEIDGKKIVMDSGMRMTNDPLPEFRSIQDNGCLDCIIISHSHMDHTGSLPSLSREYPYADIFMTHPTKDITTTLLRDSLKIMDNRESEIPIFSEIDVISMLKKIKCFGFNYTFKPFNDSEIKVTFYQAGHISGAACVFVEGKEGSVFYTGDYAVVPQKTVGGADIPKLRPDVLITESTYGDKLHANRKVEESKLIEMVKMVIERGGKILIPAFAVGRAQEVILILNSAIKSKQLPDIPVYVDGMVRNICEIYKNNPNYLKPELAKRVWKEKDVFYSKNVKRVTDNEMRKKITESDEPCCFVASSGMLIGGYSVFYADALAKDEKNYIAITGYQDEESPGRHLLDLVDKPKKERVLQIKNKLIPVLCDFGKYSLSAHGDKGEILGVIERLQPRKLFLIHGSPNVLSHLGQEVKEQKSERRRDIFIPKNGESFEFSFNNPRKQFKFKEIDSLNIAKMPENNEDLEKIWRHLKDLDRKKGFSIEELFFIQTGNPEPNEELINSFQNIINNSKYFDTEERRLFLYLPVKEESLNKKKKVLKAESEIMEPNQMLAFVNTFFPKEAGIYKAGQKFEEKIAILHFDFPLVAANKYSDLIKEFEQITKWKVQTNSFSNQIAITPLILNLLDSQADFFVKMSFNQNENYVKIHLSEESNNLEKVKADFIEKTGIDLYFEYPNKKIDTFQTEYIKPKSKALEQNQAMYLIEQAFKPVEDKLYKKGIKNDNEGSFIELTFISSPIAEKYKEWINDLVNETGWRIKTSKTNNQIEIIQKANNIFAKYKVQIVKNPSLIEVERKAKVKINGLLDETIRKMIEDEFLSITGFKLEIIK